MDAFLNKFESILQILNECGELPSERFQKILLLSRVRDDSYESVKTLLKLNTEKKFDDCVLELQKCGIDMAHNGSGNAKARTNLCTTEEKQNNNNVKRKMQGNRKSNNSSTSNTQADEKDEYYTNPEIYKQLSRKQKKLWNAMWKNEAKKNLKTPNKLPQQYGNRNDNNTSTNTSNNNLATSDYYNKSTTEDEHNFNSRVVNNSVYIQWK